MLKRTCIAVALSGLIACQLHTGSLASTASTNESTSTQGLGFSGTETTSDKSIKAIVDTIEKSTHSAAGSKQLIATGPDSSEDETTDSATPSKSADQDGSTTGDALSTESGTLEDRRNLEGKVEQKAQALEQALKGLSKGVHHLKRSTWDVFCEAQRQDVVVVAEPDVIGPIIVPAMPSASGIMSDGFLPPRKKWLDYFISQIDSLLPMVESEITAIELPENTPETIDLLKQIKDCANGLPGDLTKLKTVTSEDKLDNMKIAVEAQRMQDHVVKIDKALKSLADEIHKEDNELKKDLRQLEKQINKKGKKK